MKYFIKRFASCLPAIALILLGQLPTPSVAQATNAVAQAFAGDWITYDQRHAAQGQCILSFSATGQDALYPIKPQNCINQLANIRGWTLKNNQLIFVDDKKTPLAAVGGNQQRISGTFLQSGMPLILEKAALAQQITASRKAIRCSYLGYGQTCAKPRQFAPPAMGTDGTADIKALVNLNVRNEPRNNATVKAILKPESCVKATFCSLASDGLWCRIKLKDGIGWIKKQAVRQKQWPILTFVNGC